MKHNELSNSKVKIMKLNHEKCIEILSEHVFSNSEEYCGVKKNVITSVQVNVNGGEIELLAAFRNDDNDCNALIDYNESGFAMPVDLGFLKSYKFKEVGKCEEVSNDELERLRKQAQ